MKSILLIEDDFEMGNLLKFLFEIEGIHCTFPNDFIQETINNHIIEHNPDIILMDVNLKQNNGLLILQALKRSKILNKETKVILTSGSDLKEKCLDAGADYFLLKPYMPDELLKMIKN
jgi:DNA-binding response OmpR family regulator